MKKLSESVLEFIRTFKRVMFISSNQKHITYEGVYRDFDEALAGDQSSSGYITQEFLESEAAKVSEIVSNNKKIYSGNYRDRDLLLLLAGMTRNKICILDMGCGFGLTFHYLNNNLRKRIEYTALDLPEVISIAKQNFLNQENFHISTFDNFNQKEYDLVYFGSSLQYFEDFRGTLLRVLENKPQAIFIADTPVARIESFVTWQVNMADRKIPRWVFSLTEIIEIFNRHDYKLSGSAIVDWHNNIHNFLNFSEEYHHIEHINLVFERN